MDKILTSLHKVFYQSNLLYSIRIVISLVGTTFIPWHYGKIEYITPLTLGVIAAALTEIDTRLFSRVINIVFTLFCFALASFSVQFLFNYPLFFIIGLVSSTFVFTMLGSLGQRYAVISFGSLLIASYTMIAHNMYTDNYTLPIFLLIGALWYNLVSLIESIIQPIRTTQQALSNSFIKLALYLDAKAAMFDPDETEGFKNQTLQLTQSNNQLIESFNATKYSLFHRLKSYRGQSYIQKMLSYYFVAQDIHERASSTHGNYQALSQYFRHSDILFRFARILNLQAKACAKVGLAIKSNQTYEHDPVFTHYFTYLEEAIAEHKNEDKIPRLLINSLYKLYKNLMAIDLLLRNIDQEQHLSKQQEQNQLIDDELLSFRDIFVKIKNNLTIKSSLFRHAVRISIVVFVGYTIIHLSDISHGYWIIMTSLFVCQPNYSTTKHRLQLRVIGTVLGIIVGVPLTFLLPTIEIQLLFIIISAWLFFLFKNSQYAYATAFITLLVFFIFNLTGESSISVAFFRILATIIGCTIAWLAVTFIWPDWKFRNLKNLINRICYDDSHYLAVIGQHYASGKTNDLNYRLARRSVHDSNADLSSLITIMTKEPHMDKKIIEQGFRLLTLNHTLISYFSTLGAHREKNISAPTLELFDDITVYIINTLNESQINANHSIIKQNAIDYIEAISELNDSDNDDLLVVQQLILILDILPEMIEMVAYLKEETL